MKKDYRRQMSHDREDAHLDQHVAEAGRVDGFVPTVRNGRFCCGGYSSATLEGLRKIMNRVKSEVGGPR